MDIERICIFHSGPRPDADDVQNILSALRRRIDVPNRTRISVYRTDGDLGGEQPRFLIARLESQGDLAAGAIGRSQMFDVRSGTHRTGDPVDRVAAVVFTTLPPTDAADAQRVREEDEIEAAIRERDARRIARRTPPERLDPLVHELIQLCTTTTEIDFMELPRVREIGEQIFRRGGDQAMLDAFNELHNWHGRYTGCLDHAWDGVGMWRR